MKTLDLNNSKSLAALKEGLNKAIDKKIAEQELSEKLNEMKNLSFGELKCLFESTLSKIYDTNDGKKLISSYVKTIKENKSLKSLYKVYEQAVKGSLNANPDISAYLISDVCSGLDKKTLKEGEEKIYKIWVKAARLAESTISEMDAVLENNKVLNECVSYLSKHKKTHNNLNECASKINLLSDIIANNSVEETQVNESKDNKELIADLTDILKEGQYTTWENRVLTDLSLCELSNGSKEELFESYKQDCLNTIDEIEAEDDEDKSSRLSQMKSQLLEKKYNEETLINDLFKLSELKETLLEA